MIRHHISEDVLVSYAAGDLDEATSLFVATHLALCPSCRVQVRMAEEMGGALFEEITPAEMAEDALTKVMERLGDQDSVVIEEPVKEQQFASTPVLPEPLRSRVGGDTDAINWKMVGPGVKQLRFDDLNGQSSLRLLRISAGTAVPEHGHHGDEMTLVLAGAFGDGGATFSRGDVEHADPNVVHQPIAMPGEDCICLAVTSAPLKFFDLFGKLAQPFARI
jgi:putative transcriptional regulator